MSLGAKAESSIYYTYVLRVWAESGEQWRIVLTDPQTNESQYFSSLEALQVFLTTALAYAPPPEATSSKKEFLHDR